MDLSSVDIARIVKASAQNVSISWPRVRVALAEFGIVSDLSHVAAIATIRVECPTFKPVHEYGGDSYFEKHYEGRADLGNVEPGDGVRFAGRGFIQITGRANYKHYGDSLAVDLVGNPDRALDPDVAARIFALFFHDRRIPAAADSRDWPRVRRLVNGGLNGYDDFLVFVNALLPYISK